MMTLHNCLPLITLITLISQDEIIVALHTVWAQVESLIISGIRMADETSFMGIFRYDSNLVVVLNRTGYWLANDGSFDPEGFEWFADDYQWVDEPWYTQVEPSNPDNIATWSGSYFSKGLVLNDPTFSYSASLGSMIWSCDVSSIMLSNIMAELSSPLEVPGVVFGIAEDQTVLFCDDVSM